MRQHHVVGDIHLRKGRPALHWNEDGYRNRVEYDSRNGWHYNYAPGKHGSLTQGLRAYVSRVARVGGSAAQQVINRLTGIGRGIGIPIIVPNPQDYVSRSCDWRCVT